MPYQQVIVSVAAETKEGLGPFSENVTFQTTVLCKQLFLEKSSNLTLTISHSARCPTFANRNQQWASSDFVMETTRSAKWSNYGISGFL